MKHQHHRGASTCSTKPITEATKEGYFPLHRSITDDHDDKHAKHHYDKGKSPITRFVCKLLGLERSDYNQSRFGHKSGSTTSITKSSVFHFSSIPSPPPSSSTLSQQSHNTNAKKRTTLQTKKKKKCKNGDDEGACSISSSSSSSYTSSTLSTLSPSLSSDHNISTHCQDDPPRITTDLSNNTPLYDSNDKSIPLTTTDASHHPWQGVTPAMDALVMASQIPSVKKIQFADDFEIPPPVLTNRDPSTYPLLTSKLSEQLRPYLPRRYRLASEWCLLYSLDQHGASLSTLYRSVQESGPCIMIMKDDEHQIFGAFLNESIRLDLSYYGTGECFLWKIPPSTSNHPSGSSPSANHHPTPKIKVFPWTGKNEYMIYSTIDCIAIGGGGGKFGLWVNQDLEKGHSEPCATFDNECLSLNPLFNCIDLEIWSFRI